MMARRLLQAYRSYLGSSRQYCSSKVLTVSEEVSAALHHGKPVVALETTIVTHGMPHPHNLSTAVEVEKLVRANGSVPASIGIIKGQVYVGLDRTQLEYLADPQTHSIKSSRRDLSFVISQGLNGGTTVSATMMLAHMAGIPVFVTGGIGGVHRGAETSMDVSADLTELGRTPVTVISAGVKSILDIGRTLEYLETEGVCVATYGSGKEFPAFFTRYSGLQAPYNVQTARDAAQLIYSNQQLGLQTGTLIGVPIPEQYDILGQEVEAVIQSVIQEAIDKGIKGKEVTPYILQRVNERTEGKSLQANIHLVKNNAVVGSQIARELSRLQAQTGDECQGHSSSRSQKMGQSSARSKMLDLGKASSCKDSGVKPAVTTASKGKRVVVVGGSIVDFYAQMTAPNFQLNGATYTGSVQQSFGGVGRNLADGLTRLGVDTQFISATGDDSHRPAFDVHCSHMDLSRVAKFEGQTTATYCAVLGNNGELMFGIGDMDVHSMISPEYISQYRKDLSSASLVCVDGNISVEAIEYVCDVCCQQQVPVFFEPTDIHKATKPFLTSAHKALTYTSPNYNELKTMAAHLSGTQLDVSGSPDDLDLDSVLHTCTSVLHTVAEYVPVTIVTIGCHGVILCCQEDLLRRLPVKGDKIQTGSGLVLQHFPADSKPVNIVSVSGAGDCMVAAIISRILCEQDSSSCIRAGLQAARISLGSSSAVPSSLTPAGVSPGQGPTPSLLKIPS